MDIFGSGPTEPETVVTRAKDALLSSMPPLTGSQLMREIESWTVEDVALRFEAKGLLNYAAVIRAQVRLNHDLWFTRRSKQ